MEQLRQNQSAGGGPDAAHGPVDAKMDPPTKATSRVLPAISAALAIGIFILDAITITPAEVAVCVLYVGVVLLSARFLEKRGITLVSLGCIALTVLSYFLEPPEALPLAAISNRLLSVAAIGVTAFLAVQSKSREIVLRESEEKWKAVFENNPTMYFMVDGTGIILSVNPSGAEQLGYTADELIGRPVQSL